MNAGMENPPRPRGKRTPGGQRILFSRESVPLRLSGWAAPADVANADDELLLSLMAGPLRLGTIRRDAKRRDVEESLGYACPEPGFKIDDFGLSAFADITGFTGFGIEVARVADGSSTLYPLLPAPATDSAADPVGCRKGIRKSVRLADLWMDSRRQLTLRFEGAGSASRGIDAYQCIPGPEPRLIQLGPRSAVGGVISTASITLANPFLPVLLLFFGEDAALDAIDILPFPSLVRGGTHSAERMILGSGGDELRDLASVSAELLDGLRHRSGEIARHVSVVELDPHITTGLECSVDEDVLAWLGGALDIEVRLPCSDDVRIPDFVLDRVAAHSAPPKDGHKLQLPANSVPTIASLVHPYPSVPDAQVVGGSFAVVDWNRHGRAWSVWQPPATDSLDQFQLAGTPRFAPALHIAGSGTGDQSTLPVSLRWPLAINFKTQPTRIEGSTPLETSADLAVPLLRGAGLASPEPLSAIILFDDASADPLPLLESLARQEAVGPIDVTLCFPAGRDTSKAREALGGLFPGSSRLIELRARATAVEQLLEASVAAECDRLVVAKASTILPDSRTLATLLPMLALEGVLSVGCLIRNANDKAAGAIGAGYSIAGLDLRATPTVAFELIDPAVFERPSTYPVIANSLGFAVIHKSLLQGLESSGSVPARPGSDDLTVGILGLQKGGRHLCTTLVSVYSSAAASTKVLQSGTLPYRLSPQMVAMLADCATVVQRIR